MTDIDRMLARLASASAPTALDGLDDRVLARLGTTGSGRQPIVTALLLAVALGIGIIGSVPAPTGGMTVFAPLGGVSPLAPSALLSGE